MSYQVTAGALIQNKEFAAEVAFARIVKPSAGDNIVTVATDGTAPVCGVTCGGGTILSGKRGDVQMDKIAQIELGGTVALGAAIKAGTGGKGVAAAVGDFIIGYAEAAGVADQFIPVRISPQQLSVAA